jgi:hypothetical protein
MNMNMKNMHMDYESENEYCEDWETMSFDFGLDNHERDEDFDDVIDVESVRKYVQEERVYRTPIRSLVNVIAKYNSTPTKSENKIQNENEETEERENAEIEAVKSILGSSSWGKTQEVVTSDSDSEDEISVAPKIVKLDLEFPSLNQAATMKVQKQNTDISDGWKEVGKKDDRVKAKQILADKKQINKVLTKTKLCDSVQTGKTCRHGKNCRFAHSVDELVVSPCVFGADCKFVTCNNGIYGNSGNKKCAHQHPEEKLEDYYVRTGLKQRAPPTEEEMQQAFEEFLEEEKKPVKKPVVKKQKFVEFKKFENVQNKPKKAALKEKSRKLVSDSLEVQKIKEKNEISNKLRVLNVDIQRKSETIDRFKRMNNITEFYKKQIKKLESDIAASKQEVATLEDRLKNVDSMKKVEVVQPVIEKSEPVVVKEVKKPIVKEPVCIVLVAPVKKIEASPVVKKITPVPAPIVVKPAPAPVVKQVVEVKSEDSEWTEVKIERNNGFDILKDKTKMETFLTKTRMCSFGKDCRRGKNCRFAHSKEELNVSTCAFGNCCKFVNRTSRGFENVSKTKICMHKHPDEHINNFYFRVGIDKVPVRTVVQKPLQIQAKPFPAPVPKPLSKPVLNVNAKSWVSIV